MQALSKAVCFRTWAVIIAGLCASSLCGWAEGIKPTFLVSSTALGLEGGSMAAADFVRAVEKEGWCTARVDAIALEWYAVAPPATGDTRISVVMAGFGDQAHAFAFVAGTDGKGFSHVAHVPYRKTWHAGAQVWTPPTASLAAALRNTWEQREGGAARPLVNMCVVSETSDTVGTDTLLDSLLGDKPPMDTGTLRRNFTNDSPTSTCTTTTRPTLYF